MCVIVCFALQYTLLLLGVLIAQVVLSVLMAVYRDQVRHACSSAIVIRPIIQQYRANENDNNNNHYYHLNYRSQQQQQQQPILAENIVRFLFLNSWLCVGKKSN